MNCIDAVEGTAKSVLTQFVDLSAEYRMDVSEYIRNAKMVIDGAVLFLKSNPELNHSPDLLRDVLYDHAKAQWLLRLEKAAESDPAAAASPDMEYHAYCYDHVYARGEYPR
ncbi:hypothetical protein [Desulfosarcina ovata]|uniref:Uncharacterized protein n=2 Tax=Desulfosarcina ovata TaxID=83564 RepID=A0A5K8ALD0_9BACT|nr:hypothetical protein [Desulfosarcina ovata]BBO86405.1 hypothetical protein DSCO28_69710 [Desulfosarcina ovata subsp. sediminis]BBO93349.1 hypothetical protein DSCOOX_65290 [Desulfosarcina ovata subsp. ovata]